MAHLKPQLQHTLLPALLETLHVPLQLHSIPLALVLVILSVVAAQLPPHRTVQLVVLVLVLQQQSLHPQHCSLWLHLLQLAVLGQVQAPPLQQVVLQERKA